MTPCTARLATHEVGQLLQNIATNNFICLGNSQEVIDGFNAKGALDSRHTSVQSPSWGEEGQSFRNRKGFALVILQARVDHKHLYRVGRQHA